MAEGEAERVHSYRRLHTNVSWFGKLRSPPSGTLRKDRASELCVGAVTWNVGNTNPFALASDFVLTQLFPVHRRQYDLFVVGVQECRYDDRAAGAHPSVEDEDHDDDGALAQGGGERAASVRRVRSWAHAPSARELASPGFEAPLPLFDEEREGEREGEGEGEGGNGAEGKGGSGADGEDDKEKGNRRWWCRTKGRIGKKKGSSSNNNKQEGEEEGKKKASVRHDTGASAPSASGREGDKRGGARRKGPSPLRKLRFAVGGVVHHLGLTTKHDFVFDSVIKDHMAAHGLKPVAIESLMEMRVYVFANTHTCLGLVRDVEVATEATGLLHVYGNKGGIVVRCSVLDTTLCFVNCHLAAHSHNLNQRRQNIQELMQGARVGNKALDICAQASHVFFLGDMNFRLDPGHVQGQKAAKDKIGGDALSRKVGIVKGIVHQGKFADLRQFDQLAIEMQGGELLPGFREGLWERTHPPTFKYRKPKEVEREDEVGHNRNSRKSNNSSSSNNNNGNDNDDEAAIKKKQQQHQSRRRSQMEKGKYSVDPDMFSDRRVPSYTDRILWWSMPSLRRDVEQTDLRAVMGLNSSDHKPVQATFKVMVRPKPRRDPRRLLPTILLSDLGCTCDEPIGAVAFTITCVPDRLMHPVRLTDIGADREGCAVWARDPYAVRLHTALENLENVSLVVGVMARKRSVGFLALGLAGLTGEGSKRQIHERLILNGVRTNITFKCEMEVMGGLADNPRRLNKKTFSLARAAGWFNPGGSSMRFGFSSRNNTGGLSHGPLEEHPSRVVHEPLGEDPNDAEKIDHLVPQHLAVRGAVDAIVEEVVAEVLSELAQRRVGAQ